MTGLFDLAPRLKWVARTAVAGAHDLAFLLGPRHPSQAVELGEESIVDLEEALDIGSRTPSGPTSEAVRASRESIALGQLHAELAFVERRERRGGHSKKAGRDLGVEQMAGHGPGGEFEYLEIL